MEEFQPWPSPGENPLVDSQLVEASEVIAFLDSPSWKWMKTRLERLRPALMAKATLVGGGLKRDERMLLMGKLAMVEELLARPGMLTDLVARKDAAEMAIPEAKEVLRSVGQRFTPGKL